VDAPVTPPVVAGRVVVPGAAVAAGSVAADLSSTGAVVGDELQPTSANATIAAKANFFMEPPAWIGTRTREAPSPGEMRGRCATLSASRAMMLGTEV
jgi:hypothetical protein